MMEADCSRQTAKMDTPVDELLHKLSIQQNLLSRQKRDLEQNENRTIEPRPVENRSSNSSSPTDTFPAATPPTEAGNSDCIPDNDKVSELKKELRDANERMALMDLELNQTRLARHTMEEAIGSPFPAAQHLAANITGNNMLPGVHRTHAPSMYGNSKTPTSFERSSFNMPQMPQRPS